MAGGFPRPRPSCDLPTLLRLPKVAPHPIPAPCFVLIHPRYEEPPGDNALNDAGEAVPERNHVLNGDSLEAGAARYYRTRAIGERGASEFECTVCPVLGDLVCDADRALRLRIAGRIPVKRVECLSMQR